MRQQLTSSPRKRILDEGSFQELLAAAYVLQQHNESSVDPASNDTQVLSEIVHIGRLIHHGQSNLLATAKLIAEQVQRFTHATGVAIGIVVDTQLTYLSAIGSASHEIGLRVPLDSTLSAYCLRNGVTLESPCTERDIRMPGSIIDNPDVRALIAVPIDFEDRVVGVLEARFSLANSFQHDDVHTCELMSGLVRELITRAGQVKSASKMQLPRTESGRPDFGRNEARTKISSKMALRILPDTTPSFSGPTDSSQIPNAYAETATASAITYCRGCGQQLTEEELFCGKCGTERNSNPNGPMQKKWASMWYMKQAQKDAESNQEAEPEEASRQEAPQPRPVLRTTAAKIKQAMVQNQLASRQLPLEPASRDQEPAKQELSPVLEALVSKFESEIPTEEAHAKESHKKESRKKELQKIDLAQLEIQKPSFDTIASELDHAPVEEEADAQEAPTQESTKSLLKGPSLRIDETIEEVADAPQAQKEESLEPQHPANVLKLIPLKLKPATIEEEAIDKEDDDDEPYAAVVEEHSAIAVDEPVHAVAANPHSTLRVEWLPAAASSESWLRHHWRVNRANFYLTGASLLLIVVLLGRGITPVDEASSPANSLRPQLTLFEKVLVGLGLAEAPAAPVYLGNPDTPVWVDMHTALYYCPGSDLYGKTDGGKIASQRDAQLDQFEPAHRKACK